MSRVAKNSLVTTGTCFQIQLAVARRFSVKRFLLKYPQYLQENTALESLFNKVAGTPTQVKGDYVNTMLRMYNTATKNIF